MRTYSQFLEDLEQRKVALAQRRQQQMARIKQQNAQSASDTEERISVAKQQSAAVFSNEVQLFSVLNLRKMYRMISSLSEVVVNHL